MAIKPVTKEYKNGEGFRALVFFLTTFFSVVPLSEMLLKKNHHDVPKYPVVTKKPETLPPRSLGILSTLREQQQYGR